MSEADWREILSFSQKELIQADKEKLCESLSWMEADDIELNFSDLKTLFRLSQDILKFKSEQVNNLKGQLESIPRKSSKSKRGTYDSPGKGSDVVLETITHQEEVIKANKEILEQLYTDITELEKKKHNLEDDRNSDSSRDALSELDEVAQLEIEITLKNRHIRKLLNDVKVVGDENIELKDKLTVLKDKLKEATNLIENLTEQLYALNNENSKIKGALGKSEEIKSHLTLQIETLKKEIEDKDMTRESNYSEIKSKALHWKNIAKQKKSEIESLLLENTTLKKSVIISSQSTSLLEKNNEEEAKIKELQDKLSQATKEIEMCTDIIEKLKIENRQLQSVSELSAENQSVTENNVSDENKEKMLIHKLKKSVKTLSVALQKTEDMITVRDKELAEITSQLQLVQSHKGIKSLLDGLKNNKRLLRSKDKGIASLVQEVNSLNEYVNNLQLENETLREKLNLPRDEPVPSTGILKKLYDLEENYNKIDKMYKKSENKLITIELINHTLNKKCNMFKKTLVDLGYSEKDIDKIEDESDDNNIPKTPDSAIDCDKSSKSKENSGICDCKAEMEAIAKENEGLRRGLQEILNFIKDNSTTSSGVLTLQCPSLDSVLQSMEARHSAGWYGPHMSTVMELRAALGGRDALLIALHEARKETFDILEHLSEETKKSSELQKKLEDFETTHHKAKSDKTDEFYASTSNKAKIFGKFGSWVSFEETQFDFYNKSDIDNHISIRNQSYEDYLKQGLNYFHDKFKSLFEKMTSIVIQTSDQQNQWSIQEEQYKAEIENLKALISNRDDEDSSEYSPGIVVTIPSTDNLERKCSFLEDAYKHIRTVNENMKNEILESKKETMLLTLEYETQIQSLMLVIANLSDKLRNSISLEAFWKQNHLLNDAILNYRRILDKHVRTEQTSNFCHQVERQKLDIVNKITNVMQDPQDQDKLNTILTSIETLMIQHNVKELCKELDDKNKEIKTLQEKYIEMQQMQTRVIDDSLAAESKKERDLMKKQLLKLAEDNSILKEQYHITGSQLDIALLQLQDIQQRQLSHDIEVNMLRHQILDLQSTGDNKAIIARLGGEVLVAHLQASESNKKIERLSTLLNKERQSRIEAEEMLKARQNIYEIYATRYELRFRYMFEIMQSLRQQYHGAIPLASLENYMNKLEELTRKTHAANEKLEDIEDLQYSLMTKHSIYDQVLDLSKNKCLEELDGCPHKLRIKVLENTHTRDESYYVQKVKAMELSQQNLLHHCNKLENILILVNQGFEKSSDINTFPKRNDKEENQPELKLEEIKSDDESSSRRSQTVTLTKPQILKPVEKPVPSLNKANMNCIDVSSQTSIINIQSNFKSTQTDNGQEVNDVIHKLNRLRVEKEKAITDLVEADMLLKKQSRDFETLYAKNKTLDSHLQNLRDLNNAKDKLNEKLVSSIDNLKGEINDIKSYQIAQSDKLVNAANEDNKSLVLALKHLENEKNSITDQYTELLRNERDEYSKASKELHAKIIDLQSKLDSKESDTNASIAQAVKEVISKYTLKIFNLEDKCFKLQSELDGRNTELMTYNSEVDRWKDLAVERLSKMEQLKSQLEERHCHEVDSYKAENQHWLTQLNETQKEHMDLRTRLSEQKALYIKQLADKDTVIEQLRSAVHNLKTQIINMQTMISVNDPSFDLTAIVEVDESSDVISQSDRLELKFDSSVDIHEMQDDLRIPASSTTIWQEPVIERLRREKQLAFKQNAVLRRQIKALAARERRSRLDAQNLKNQIFRISTSGSKAATAETVALQSKIASLQAQLTSERRDTNSSIALWDKWKRSQQSAERWQARYEEKCQDVKKLESQVNLAKSAVLRLEREKRLLLSRLSEVKNEKHLLIEKQETETLEKCTRGSETERSESPPPSVSTRALLDRVQAQQRRIVALEISEQGNEYLVSEYEKALAQITSLKGQVLKLESTILESQIRTPTMKTTNESQPELDYWKSYCDMLKEENMQLNMRVSALETTPATADQHRVNDLERTVLTLRGLVSKLQADQKSSVIQKRTDSRPGSGRSIPDKTRSKSMDSHRIEIANLKRSIQEKDLLLEKSKEMLNIAAEREDELLRENTYLRRRLEEMANSKSEFLSAEF